MIVFLSVMMVLLFLLIIYTGALNVREREVLRRRIRILEEELDFIKEMRR